MSAGWSKGENGLVARTFTRDEVSVLESLASGLDETLDSVDRRDDDDVLSRLLPRAYDDAEDDAAEEFASHTAARIAEGKQLRLRAVAADLQTPSGEAVPRHRTRPSPGIEVVLDDDGAQRWLLALNDMRLGLAERLGVGREDDEGGPQDRGPVGDVLDWLGWLQSGLLDVGMGVR